MARFSLRPLGAIAAVMLLASCQNVDDPLPDAATTTTDLAEFYGGGQLQLSPGRAAALAEFLRERRDGLLAISRTSSNHAHLFCDRGDCSADDARRVIDQCNRMTRLSYRTCGLFVAGRQIVWRGEVVDPSGRLTSVEDHNRRIHQALVIDFPSQSATMVAALYIDESNPIGIFTVESGNFGGFCQGTYDFLSPAAGTWDLRCNDGFEVSGSFHSEDLPRGGSGTGSGNHGEVVRLVLMPRS